MKDFRMNLLAAIDAEHPIGKGGTGLADYPTLRPLRGRVLARRRGMWDHVKAAGLVVPDLLDRPDSQQRGMFYDVIAVGAGVTSVRPGDCVVVNNCVAADRGDILGDGVYEFSCDVDYVDRRTHETEVERLPDGSPHAYLRRMSDTERRSCGDVLAVVLTGAEE
jgi:co-chaperonin GroES (HSP10)